MNDQQRPPFQRIAWIRAAEKDPRITGGPLDLAKVMGVAADKYGRCDLTIRQIQERLVLRTVDGEYIPERTIKSWRTKLKALGLMDNVKPGAGAGFAGPGRGRGGEWQLLLNGQVEDAETGKDIAPSTANAYASTRKTPAPRGIRAGAKRVVGRAAASLSSQGRNA
jgi:hypothetical protein